MQDPVGERFRNAIYFHLREGSTSTQTRWLPTRNPEAASSLKRPFSAASASRAVNCDSGMVGVLPPEESDDQPSLDTPYGKPSLSCRAPSGTSPVATCAKLSCMRTLLLLLLYCSLTLFLVVGGIVTAGVGTAVVYYHHVPMADHGLDTLCKPTPPSVIDAFMPRPMPTGLPGIAASIVCKRVDLLPSLACSGLVTYSGRHVIHYTKGTDMLPLQQVLLEHEMDVRLEIGRTQRQLDSRPDRLKKLQQRLEATEQVRATLSRICDGELAVTNRSTRRGTREQRSRMDGTDCTKRSSCTLC